MFYQEHVLYENPGACIHKRSTCICGLNFDLTFCIWKLVLILVLCSYFLWSLNNSNTQILIYKYPWFYSSMISFQWFLLQHYSLSCYYIKLKMIHNTFGFSNCVAYVLQRPSFAGCLTALLRYFRSFCFLKWC